MRIELFSRLTWRGRRWFFRVRSVNSKIIAQSEAYSRKIDARATAETMIANLQYAEISDA